MRHPGEVLSRERILDHVWDDEYDAGSNVIDVHLKNLRRKVDGAGGPRLLQTVRGVGYGCGPRCAAPRPATAGDAVRTRSRAPTSSPARRTRLVVLFTAIVVLLVVVSGVFMYLTVKTNIAERRPGRPASGESEVESRAGLALDRAACAGSSWPSTA